MAAKSSLGQRLFLRVQESQGRSYISDAIEDLSDEQVLEIAKIALEWTKETVIILRRFIREQKAKY